MRDDFNAWILFEKVTWGHVLIVLAVFLLARLLSSVLRWVIRHLAEKAPPRLRLSILRAMPITRLLMGVVAIVVAIPILVEPNFRNVVTLAAGVSLVLAFALKDYGSSLVAGLATVLENAYQPGDWIEIDGFYGEVMSINLRAVTILTPDDTEVIIPHLRFWSAGISNATSGNRSVLCVTQFYLHPDHDALAVRQRLAEVAEASPHRKPNSIVTVVVREKPWGTQYRLKAYVKESRDQFLFITDLTLRGKEALREMGIRFAYTPYVETAVR